MTAQRAHATALAAYVSACTCSLLFCLTRTQASAGADSKLPVTTGSALERDPPALISSNPHGFVGVLGAVLQTQLGVFVFANFVIACCAALAAITTSVFLESLTPSEAGRLTQRLLKYLLFKVALVGMVLLPSEVQLLHWLPWLAVIGEMKMFVGLAKDRLAGLSVTPTVGLSRHIRTLCLLGFILCSNVLGLALLHSHQGALSWAVRLLLTLDLGIIGVEATKAALSCVSLLMDEALAVSTPSLQLSATLRGRAMCLWDSWQGKGRDKFFYHTELLADVAVHVLTLLHHVYVWLLHGMSFNLLDALLLFDTRVVLTSFVHRVKAHMLHRAATHSLDHSFPDATDKLLSSTGAECAICRDKLSAAKQLPCGHLFHLPCLRAWLQQSGHDNFKCPICRRTLCVLVARCPNRSDSASRAAAAAGGAGGQQWGLRRDSRAGLMGHLSLSMSYNDLSAAGRGNQQVSLEEQLLREVGAAGFGGDGGGVDGNGSQLLAAESLVSNGSDGENFDALLAQALAASLQTAHMPHSAASSTEAHDPTHAQQGVVAAAAVGPTEPTDSHTAAAVAARDSSSRGSGQECVDQGSVEQQQQQQQEQQGRAGLRSPAEGSPQGLQKLEQGLLQNSHSSSAVTGLSRRKTNRTASLPLELLAFDCSKGAGVCVLAAAASDAVQQHGGDQCNDACDAAAWSDPLSDSDVLPSQGHSMRDTCSRMLSSLIHTRASSHQGVSTSHGSSTSTARTSSTSKAAALSSKAVSTQQCSSAGLRQRHRHSWSCGHLPDVPQSSGAAGLQQHNRQQEWRDAGALNAAVAAGEQGPVLGPSDSPAGPVELLLLQPRDPVRRRQGGRWGRRRIVVDADLQGPNRR